VRVEGEREEVGRVSVRVLAFMLGSSFMRLYEILSMETLGGGLD